MEGASGVVRRRRPATSPRRRRPQGSRPRQRAAEAPQGPEATPATGSKGIRQSSGEDKRLLSLLKVVQRVVGNKWAFATVRTSSNPGGVPVPIEIFTEQIQGLRAHDKSNWRDRAGTNHMREAPASGRSGLACPTSAASAPARSAGGGACDRCRRRQQFALTVVER